ncbi:hypothetical protein N9D95_03210, partial [Flavobacteriales bacterium]|nr:hypothetical protein [Flavobacteriales bacterium]
MYKFAICLLAFFSMSSSLLLSQGVILEKLHESEVPWFVTDETGSTINLVEGLQTGQVLLVMPVRRSANILNQLAPFEEVLAVLGESGSQQLSMALVEVTDHDLASDSWVSETSFPIYSGPSATLTDIALDMPLLTYTTIQKLPDGRFIEARRFLDTYSWERLPLFSLLYQSATYSNFENTENSFLTLNAGFPALEDSWCDAVGCQVEDLETYALGAGASESDPNLWQAYNGLVGTSQDGTVVQDPTNPNNKVLELKTDSVNGDVGFANKHLHVFSEYEVEFKILRRENKGASFIGFLGEFGESTTLIGQGLGYTGYFGRLYIEDDGEASTYWYERRGLDLNLEPEIWHHIKVGFSVTEGYNIKVNGNVVSVPSPPDNNSYRPKLSAFNWWAHPDIDSEFLIDDVIINPIYRRVANDFEGCSNPNACNYSLAASSAQELCEFPEFGHDCNGECIQDSDNDGICDTVVGCTDPAQPVYDPAATESEECCTAHEELSLNSARVNAKGILLRKYAWSLSRVVVADSIENTYYDSEEGGLDDYQADDQWLFAQEGQNTTNISGSTPYSPLVYHNNYVTQNHLTQYLPEFGVYEMPQWRLWFDYCTEPESSYDE